MNLFLPQNLRILKNMSCAIGFMRKDKIYSMKNVIRLISLHTHTHIHFTSHTLQYYLGHFKHST
jgi:hypothetical protein